MCLHRYNNLLYCYDRYITEITMSPCIHAFVFVGDVSWQSLLVIQCLAGKVPMNGECLMPKE